MLMEKHLSVPAGWGQAEGSGRGEWQRRVGEWQRGVVEGCGRGECWDLGVQMRVGRQTKQTLWYGVNCSITSSSTSF